MELNLLSKFKDFSEKGLLLMKIWKLLTPRSCWEARAGKPPVLGQLRRIMLKE